MSNHSTYRTRLVYEIIENETDQVMDRIDEVLYWPATAEQAVMHKYRLMNHVYSIREGEDETVLMQIVRKIWSV